MKKLIVAVVMLIIAATQSFADEHSDAKYMAKVFVEKTLKAPSTAKFEPVQEFAAVQKKDNKKRLVWQVMGYVDAQNEFGAMLRKDFMVTLQKKGDSWKALDIYFFKNRI